MGCWGSHFPRVGSVESGWGEGHRLPAKQVFLGKGTNRDGGPAMGQTESQACDMPYLILIETLSIQYYCYPHFIDGKTEAEKG